MLFNVRNIDILLILSTTDLLIEKSENLQQEWRRGQHGKKLVSIFLSFLK